jgi:NAD(P)-dependent dehydrogenase (short-subunit alcohol dehydrogenase family)
MISRNKTALVTGGGRGIGAAICKLLAQNNIFVVVGYNKNKDAAEETSSQINSRGGKSIIWQIRNESRQSIFDGIKYCNKNCNGIDILVNNGAISQEKDFLLLDDMDWDNMMIANLRGAFISIQGVLPSMIQNKWGRIINITSIGGQLGGVNQIHYATSKAGLIGLTKSIARTYGKYNINCNAVSPGLIETDMSKNEINSKSGKQKIINIPLQKIGNVDDVAESVLYLVSKSGNYITGQTLNINGGQYFG